MDALTMNLIEIDSTVNSKLTEKKNVRWFNKIGKFTITSLDEQIGSVNLKLLFSWINYYIERAAIINPNRLLLDKNSNANRYNLSNPDDEKEFIQLKQIVEYAKNIVNGENQSYNTLLEKFKETVSIYEKNESQLFHFCHNKYLRWHPNWLGYKPDYSKKFKDATLSDILNEVASRLDKLYIILDSNYFKEATKFDESFKSLINEFKLTINNMSSNFDHLNFNIHINKVNSMCYTRK